MTDETEEVVAPKLRRGFALMSAARRQEVARMGGGSVLRTNRSFSTNTELAREAGRKGGRKVAAAKRSFSRDPELAREAGRRGGSKGKGKKKGETDDSANS